MLADHADASQAIRARLNAAMEAERDLPNKVRVLIEAVPGRIVFSTSLGMEDQAVLHGIAMADPTRRIDVVTLDTGRHFPETLALLDASESRFGRRIALIAPERGDVEALVKRDGVFGFRHSIEARKACCHVRKVAPLRRVLQGAAAWITGLRREQSAGRADVPFVAWDDEHHVLKVNPIADWSLDVLEDYVMANDVPVNPLHAQGHPSIGCQPCTRAVRPGEDIRAGRWWWEQQDGKECGLHNSPHRKAARVDVHEETTV